MIKRTYFIQMLVMTTCFMAASYATESTEEELFPEKPTITEISNIPWTPTQPGIRPKVIYGEDDRIDVYEETDPQRLEWAASTCALVHTSRLTQHADGSYTISAPGAYRRFGLPPCDGEPFGDQPVGAYCTGFMVGTDLIATAGHCYTSGSYADTRFIFGFWMLDEATPRLTFDADEVYQGVEVVSYSPSGSYDHTVVRVDRPIHAPGARPFNIRRQGVIMPGEYVGIIGHPAGLPMKLAFGNTYVRSSSHVGYFVANLDAYGGNSGSPVINAGTGILEGILVRGDVDFISRGDCFESNVLPNDGGRGEDVTKATVFAEAVPDISGAYISIDREYYQCSDAIDVQVVNWNLEDAGMIIVRVESAFGDIETFALPVLEGVPGVFEGSIPLVAGAPVPGSGYVEVAHGDIVSLYYEYAEDEEMPEDTVEISVSAVIDCYPPTISDVQVTHFTGVQARIAFTTDEPASALIHYGFACNNLAYTASDAQLLTEHTVTLSGLVPDSRYYFVVEAVDRAGNMGYDDNNGACYSLFTLDSINHFTEEFHQTNPTDIAHSQITFIPVEHPNYYAACFGPASTLPMPAVGTLFPLGDDDYIEVPLEHGARFTFYGDEYDRLYIGSNGFVTFGAGSTSYQALLSQHFLLPRISALMCDLNPVPRGDIFGIQLSDRYVITFQNVPVYDASGAYPPANSHTFQMELFFDGMIRITWLEIFTVRAIVGLSRGLGTPTGFTSADISGFQACADLDFDGLFHSADTDENWRISIEELLRVVQFYNVGEYHCEPESVDGYAAGAGQRDCQHHDSDYAPADWRVDLGELLRAIQLYNANGYRPDPGSEDGYHPLP